MYKTLCGTAHPRLNDGFTTREVVFSEQSPHTSHLLHGSFFRPSILFWVHPSLPTVSILFISCSLMYLMLDSSHQVEYPLHGVRPFCYSTFCFPVRGTGPRYWLVILYRASSSHLSCQQITKATLWLYAFLQLSYQLVPATSNLDGLPGRVTQPRIIDICVIPHFSAHSSSQCWMAIMWEASRVSNPVSQ